MVNKFMDENEKMPDDYDTFLRRSIRHLTPDSSTLLWRRISSIR